MSCNADSLMVRLANANSRRRSVAVALADAFTEHGTVPSAVAARYTDSVVLFNEARRAWDEYVKATAPAAEQVAEIVADMLPGSTELMAVPS